MSKPSGYTILSSCGNCTSLNQQGMMGCYCDHDNSYKDLPDDSATTGDLATWRRGREVQLNGNCPQHRGN